MKHVTRWFMLGVVGMAILACGLAGPASAGEKIVLNVVMATFDALDRMRSPQKEAIRRGKSVEDLLPFWERRKQHAQ